MKQQFTGDRRFAALMQAAQNGDSDAYLQLLSEIPPLLRRAIHRQRRYLQPADIEDIVQDILVSLHAVRATYDPSRPFLPWLLAIARNRMTDAARRYGRRTVNEMSVAEYPETFSDDRTNTLDDIYGDPEALKGALAQLPRGQREAIEMLKLRELSLKEASAASGLSIAALKVAVHRGMKTLRKALRVKR